MADAAAVVAQIEGIARDTLRPVRLMFKQDGWTKEFKAIVVLALAQELRKLEREIDT